MALINESPAGNRLQYSLLPVGPKYAVGEIIRYARAELWSNQVVFNLHIIYTEGGMKYRRCSFSFHRSDWVLLIQRRHRVQPKPDGRPEGDSLKRLRNSDRQRTPGPLLQAQLYYCPCDTVQ